MLQSSIDKSPSKIRLYRILKNLFQITSQLINKIIFKTHHITKKRLMKKTNLGEIRMYKK